MASDPGRVEVDGKSKSLAIAGASWMGEYGNPDIPEEWAYIKTWSPYHLLDKDAKYAKAFFWTTTKDDRVHPGHARKMAAKMIDQGHLVYYFENIEGGHGSGSVSSQRAVVVTMASPGGGRWRSPRSGPSRCPEGAGWDSS